MPAFSLRNKGIDNYYEYLRCSPNASPTPPARCPLGVAGRVGSGMASRLVGDGPCGGRAGWVGAGRVGDGVTGRVTVGVGVVKTFITSYGPNNVCMEE